MNNIIIIGTGGLAREFTSWCSDISHIVGYSSTILTEHCQFKLPGVFYEGEISQQIVRTDQAVLAIGTPNVKKIYYEKLSKLGFKFPPFIHPSSVVSDITTIGEGVVVSPNCVVSPNATLGKLVYVNFCCGIGHDAVIGDFVQINPGCQIGGFSKVGDLALIGSGATILDRVSVGIGATVGSGSVVFNKVSDSATVMGNPAKRMRAFEK